MYILRWPDIDLETGLISVTKQWTTKDGLHPTKNNRNRVVPISPDLKGLLLELKQLGPFKEVLRPGFNKQRKASGVPLENMATTLNDLVLPRGPEWRCGEQAKVLKAFCKQIGIPEINFHDLRATFITNLLSQGVSLAKPWPLSVIQKLRLLMNISAWQAWMLKKTLLKIWAIPYKMNKQTMSSIFITRGANGGPKCHQFFSSSWGRAK